MFFSFISTKLRKRGHLVDLAVAEGINREREARSTAPYKLHVLDIAPPAETAPASSSNVEDAFEEKKGVENYEHVVLGGTFDHLHSGHKILLAMSAWLATKSVTVGIIGERYFLTRREWTFKMCCLIAPDLLKSKKGAEWMESIETRTANVDKFLNTFKRGLVYDLPTIYDPFGPTKWDPKLQAIVGSRETLQGCVAVNEERKKADLSLLDIYIIDVISSSTANVADMKEKLSSTDIRLWVHRLENAVTTLVDIARFFRYLEKRKKQVVEGEADHQHEQAAANGAPA